MNDPEQMENEQIIDMHKVPSALEMEQIVYLTTTDARFSMNNANRKNDSRTLILFDRAICIFMLSLSSEL